MAGRRKRSKGGSRVWFELAVICILTALAAYLGNWGKNEEAARRSRPAAEHRQAQAERRTPPVRSDRPAAVAAAPSAKAKADTARREPPKKAEQPRQEAPKPQTAAAQPERRAAPAQQGASASQNPAQGRAAAAAPASSSSRAAQARPADRPSASKPEENKASRAAAAGRPSPSAETREYRLAYAGDGDSFELIDDRGARITVRLYGIDAPEFKQRWGQESRANAIRLMQGKKLQIRTIYTDNYQRTVALVYLRQNGRTDALSINQRQVQAGLAWVYDYFCTSDICNTWKLEEALAQKQRIGLWQDESPIPPWQWRKSHSRR